MPGEREALGLLRSARWAPKAGRAAHFPRAAQLREAPDHPGPGQAPSGGNGRERMGIFHRRARHAVAAGPRSPGRPSLGTEPGNRLCKARGAQPAIRPAGTQGFANAKEDFEVCLVLQEGGTHASGLGGERKAAAARRPGFGSRRDLGCPAPPIQALRVPAAPRSSGSREGGRHGSARVNQWRLLSSPPLWSWPFK